MKKLPREYTREQLYEYYIVLNKTRKEIASTFHTVESIIDHDLKKYNIRKPKELRLISQGQKIDIKKEDLYDYYITNNHTTDETAKHFNVNERTIRRRLRSFGITKTVEMQVQASFNSQKEKYGSCYTQSEYYRTSVVPNMVKKIKKTCLEKYGCDWVSKAPEIKIKMRETSQKKFGCEFYTQTEEYHKAACHKYIYDGESFDSTWELALWIYAKDHNENIIRNPQSYSYEYKGKKYRYFPDFLYKNDIIEIKGNQLLDENNNLVEIYSKNSNEKLRKKQECMEQHGVKVWSYEKIKFALDYVHDKYGSGYLKKFKRKKAKQ